LLPKLQFQGLWNKPILRAGALTKIFFVLNTRASTWGNSDLTSSVTLCSAWARQVTCTTGNIWRKIP
jgi:hypothetical protein